MAWVPLMKERNKRKEGDQKNACCCSASDGMTAQYGSARAAIKAWLVSVGLVARTAVSGAVSGSTALTVGNGLARERRLLGEAPNGAQRRKQTEVVG
jgi:hypothetical protein